jgi:hypothetical protein
MSHFLYIYHQAESRPQLLLVMFIWKMNMSRYPMQVEMKLRLFASILECI